MTTQLEPRREELVSELIGLTEEAHGLWILAYIDRPGASEDRRQAVNAYESRERLIKLRETELGLVTRAIEYRNLAKMAEQATEILGRVKQMVEEGGASVTVIGPSDEARPSPEIRRRARRTPAN